MNVADIDDWFTREVLPLEAALTRFLRRRWRHDSDIADLRQEVYVRLCDSARNGAPRQVKPFVFTVARNLIIDLARREPPLGSHTLADEASSEVADMILPDHEAIAREGLQILQHAMNQLPHRCREVVLLRRLEGLSQRDTAARMGITEHTVERQMVKGMRSLAGALARTYGNGLLRPSHVRSLLSHRQLTSGLPAGM
jgi:RNA polymerase sigma factor (sigma-70 family)